MYFSLFLSNLWLRMLDAAKTRRKTYRTGNVKKIPNLFIYLRIFKQDMPNQK